MRATASVAMRYLVHLAILSLPGCAALGGRPSLPDAPVQDAFAYEAVGPFERSGEEAGAWWRDFDDPLLSTLVTDARAANLDLRGAVKRAEAAQARTRAARR